MPHQMVAHSDTSHRGFDSDPTLSSSAVSSRTLNKNSECCNNLPKAHWRAWLRNEVKSLHKMQAACRMLQHSPKKRIGDHGCATKSAYSGKSGPLFRGQTEKFLAELPTTNIHEKAKALNPKNIEETYTGQQNAGCGTVLGTRIAAVCPTRRRPSQ